ncbi:hypothetical protein V6N13_084268 [Hibiscus sabdariffa]
MHVNPSVSPASDSRIVGVVVESGASDSTVVVAGDVDAVSSLANSVDVFEVPEIQAEGLNHDSGATLPDLQCLVPDEDISVAANLSPCSAIVMVHCL